MSFGPPLVIQEEFEGLAGIDQIFIYGPWAARYAGERGPAPRLTCFSSASRTGTLPSRLPAAPSSGLRAK